MGSPVWSYIAHTASTKAKKLPGFQDFLGAFGLINIIPFKRYQMIEGGNHPAFDNLLIRQAPKRLSD